MAPRSSCRAPILPGKASLQFKHGTRTDSLAFLWRRGAATAKADFGLPTATTAYSFCVYASSGGPPELIVDLTAPQGGFCNNRPCWKEGRKGFRYADRSASQAGLRAVAMTSGIDGRSSVTVRAKGFDLLLPAMPLNDSSVTAQLISSDDQCWGATFTAPHLKNVPSLFRDKAD